MSNLPKQDFYSLFKKWESEEKEDEKSWLNEEERKKFLTYGEDAEDGQYDNFWDRKYFLPRLIVAGILSAKKTLFPENFVCTPPVSLETLRNCCRVLWEISWERRDILPREGKEDPKVEEGRRNLEIWLESVGYAEDFTFPLERDSATNLALVLNRQAITPEIFLSWLKACRCENPLEGKKAKEFFLPYRPWLTPEEQTEEKKDEAKGFPESAHCLLQFLNAYHFWEKFSPAEIRELLFEVLCFWANSPAILAEMLPYPPSAEEMRIAWSEVIVQKGTRWEARYRNVIKRFPKITPWIDFSRQQPPQIEEWCWWSIPYPDRNEMLREYCKSSYGSPFSDRGDISEFKTITDTEKFRSLASSEKGDFLDINFSFLTEEETELKYWYLYDAETRPLTWIHDPQTKQVYAYFDGFSFHRYCVAKSLPEFLARWKFVEQNYQFLVEENGRIELCFNATIRRGLNISDNFPFETLWFGTDYSFPRKKEAEAKFCDPKIHLSEGITLIVTPQGTLLFRWSEGEFHWSEEAETVYEDDEDEEEDEEEAMYEEADDSVNVRHIGGRRRDSKKYRSGRGIFFTSNNSNNGNDLDKICFSKVSYWPKKEDCTAFYSERIITATKNALVKNLEEFVFLPTVLLEIVGEMVSIDWGKMPRCEAELVREFCVS